MALGNPQTRFASFEDPIRPTATATPIRRHPYWGPHYPPEDVVYRYIAVDWESRREKTLVEPDLEPGYFKWGKGQDYDGEPSGLNAMGVTVHKKAKEEATKTYSFTEQSRKFIEDRFYFDLQNFEGRPGNIHTLSLPLPVPKSIFYEGPDRIRNSYEEAKTATKVLEGVGGSLSEVQRKEKKKQLYEFNFWRNGGYPWIRAMRGQVNKQLASYSMNPPEVGPLGFPDAVYDPDYN